MNLSIVIPVFNEHDSLQQLHQEICAVGRSEDFKLQIIFVDDGSTDDSWALIRSLAEQDERVRGIGFRRNFGKAAAISAGVKAADYDLVVTMDADLQDDPKEIPKFLQEMEKGFDVVSGWKKIRHDPLHKRLPSKVFNFMVNMLSGLRLHDHNCGFKLYRREIFDDVHLYGELHRFIPVLAASKGWNVSEVIVEHRARQHGKSKYGLSRLIKGLLDLLTVSFLTSYNHRPQHLLGSTGLFSALLGMAGLIYLAIYWVLRINWYPDWTPVHQRPLALYSMGALIVGVQLLAIGFLAELLVANQAHQNQPYSIRRRAGTFEDRSAGKD